MTFLICASFIFAQNFTKDPRKPYFQGDIKVKDTAIFEGVIEAGTIKARTGVNSVMIKDSLVISDGQTPATRQRLSVKGGVQVSDSPELTPGSFDYSGGEFYFRNETDSILLGENIWTEINNNATYAGGGIVYGNTDENISGGLKYDGYSNYFSNGIEWIDLNSNWTGESIHVLRRNDTIAIRSSISDSKDIIILTKIATNQNYLYNFQYTYKCLPTDPDDLDDYYTNTKIHTDTDAPGTIGNLHGATRGGNHGYDLPYIRSVGHDKDASDLESRWTNGTYTWTLVKIGGDTLYMLPDVHWNSGYWSRYAACSGTISHVSGATHTGNITITSQGVVTQYPVLKNLTYEFLIDGITPLVSGMSVDCHFLIVNEYYEVTDPRTWEVTAPMDYTSGDVWFSRRSKYVFQPYAACDYTSTVELTDTLVTGMVRAFNSSPITKHSWDNILDYMPNSKPITVGEKTYNFNYIDTITTAPTEDVDVEFSYLEDDTKPIERNIELISDDVDGNIMGFVVGYATTKASFNSDDRLERTDNGLSWQINATTAKQYPILMNDSTEYIDTSFTFQMYRQYFDVEDEDYTALYYHKESGVDFLYVDYHQLTPSSLVDDIAIPYYLQDRYFKVIDSDSLTFSSYYSGSQLSITATGLQSYAIIQFGKKYVLDSPITDDTSKWEFGTYGTYTLDNVGVGMDPVSAGYSLSTKGTSSGYWHYNLSSDEAGLKSYNQLYSNTNGHGFGGLYYRYGGTLASIGNSPTNAILLQNDYYSRISSSNVQVAQEYLRMTGTTASYWYWKVYSSSSLTERLRVDGSGIKVTGAATITQTGAPTAADDMIYFINENDADPDTIAIYNGTNWKYFISE